MSTDNTEEKLADEAINDPNLEETVDDTADVEVVEEAPDEEVIIMASEFEKLQSTIAELRDQLMRQQAEFENVRKRLRKTADEAGIRSLARFVRPLLNEMDNFEMAIKAANPEKFNDFAMGVTMIHENVKGVFSGAGIQIVQADGIFDPAKHEVVAEIEQEDVARGQIIEVQRNGYQLNDQIIRAAQVIVAKPPAPATEASAETDAAADEAVASAETEEEASE